MMRARRSLAARLFAGGGYQGLCVGKAAADTGNWVVEIVKRTDLHKFIVLPKRWIVERTLA
jgi:putative transposase